MRRTLAILIVLLLPAIAAADVCEPGWHAGAPLPEEIFQVGAAPYGGRVFVAGGTTNAGYLNAMLVYDLALDEWSVGDSYDDQGWTGACLVAHAERLYLIGGFAADEEPNYHNDTLIYDIATGEWSAAAPAPYAVADGACVVIEDTIYLAGGTTDRGQYLDRVAAYDIANDDWDDSLARLPLARAGALGTSDGEWLYLIGGRTSADMLAETLAYDPAADEWSALADLNQPRVNPGGGYAFDALYAFAGGGDDGEQYSAQETSEVYRLADEEWKTFVPSPGVPLVAAGSAFVPDDGGVFVLVGGAAMYGADVIAAEANQIYRFCHARAAQVIPPAGENDQEVEITVVGAGFELGDTVTLHHGGDALALTGSVIDQDQLVAVVPVGLPAGVYDLEIVSRGESTWLLKAYEVLEPDYFVNDDEDEDDDEDEWGEDEDEDDGCLDAFCWGCAAGCGGSCDTGDDDTPDDDTDDDTPDDDTEDDDDKDDDNEKGEAEDDGCGC